MGDVNDDPRRSGILEAARRLFARTGPQKTTVADIAREAGVGVGTVYLEFESKDAIVSELCGTMHGAVIHAMREVLAQGNALEVTFVRVAEARVRAFLVGKARNDRAFEIVMCVTDGTRREQARFFERERALYVELFARAQSHGELGPGDAFRTAELVQLAFASLSPPGLFVLPEDDAVSRARDLALLLVRGLAGR